MAARGKQPGKERQARAANADRRKKRRRGKRTLHHILVLIFVLAAGAWLCLTVFFKIEAVTVLGADKYTPDEIVLASGIIIGDNLFRVSSEAVEKQLLEKFPYIESVRLHRKLPPTIEIELTQSVPVGAIAQGSEYVLISGDGKVLERGLVYLPDNILLIKGVNAGDKQPGEYLGQWVAESRPDSGETAAERAARLERNARLEEVAEKEKDAMVMLTYLYEAIGQTDFKEITNVDISDPYNMQVMYENRLLLKLGSEADLVYKLEFIDTVMAKLHPDAHGTIDASGARDKRVIYKHAPGYRDDGSPIAESENTVGEEENP